MNSSVSATRKFRRRENLGKKSLGRRDCFPPKIVEIGAILAIFEPFQVRQFCMPFFGELGRSSQDLCESDYDSPKSRDDRLDSSKSGMWIFSCWYDDMMICVYDHRILWMIIWYDDMINMMIWWCDDMLIWWCDYMVIRWCDYMMIWIGLLKSVRSIINHF